MPAVHAFVRNLFVTRCTVLPMDVHCTNVENVSLLLVSRKRLFFTLVQLDRSFHHKLQHIVSMMRLADTSGTLPPHTSSSLVVLQENFVLSDHVKTQDAALYESGDRMENATKQSVEASHLPCRIDECFLEVAVDILASSAEARDEVLVGTVLVGIFVVLAFLATPSHSFGPAAARTRAQMLLLGLWQSCRRMMCKTMCSSSSRFSK